MLSANRAQTLGYKSLTAHTISQVFLFKFASKGYDELYVLCRLR